MFAVLFFFQIITKSKPLGLYSHDPLCLKNQFLLPDDAWRQVSLTFGLVVLGKEIIHSSSKCIISTSLLFHLGKGFGLSVEQRVNLLTKDDLPVCFSW